MKNWSAALQFLIVGFYVPISLLIPTGIGLWLDRRASHEFPLCTIIGLGIGTVIMVYGVYQMLRPFLKEAKREGKESRVRQKRAKSATLLNSRQEKDKE
ncbi:MAG: AtpZ/AtpI family protein [Deltaproteobacteria bacterium]|nr:AtpZ/AtpI family protein [Deltaproteobacteria bacterium]